MNNSYNITHKNALMFLATSSSYDDTLKRYNKGTVANLLQSVAIVNSGLLSVQAYTFFG